MGNWQLAFSPGKGFVYATNPFLEGARPRFFFHTRTCTAPRLAQLPQALHAAACVVLPLTALRGYYGAQLNGL